MKLKAVYQKKEDIPAALVEFYTEESGEWVLVVDGLKTQADFDNYAEALKKRFTDQAADLSKKGGAGITRDELLEALEKFAKPNGDGGGDDGKGNGKGNGDLDARLHDLERTVASLNETNEKLQTERDDALGNSRKTTIRNELNTAGLKAGATPEGISSLVTLVEPNFEVAQDGSVVTKLEANGGVSPNQKPADFFAAASRNPEYRMFWGKSVGGGADGDGPGPGAGDALGKGNPWSKAGWNMTEQGTMYRKDPTEAGRLMDAAGVKLGAVAPVR